MCGLGLYACNSHPVSEGSDAPPIQALRNYKHIMDVRQSPFIQYPEIDKFSICHGNTCKFITNLSLAGAEWHKVRVLLESATSAAEEREQIRQAVSLLENIIGDRTGTGSDPGENGYSGTPGGQMDCVDEATNTSVYLTLMQQENLLRWHRVQRRVSRGVSTLQGPHFTAVIRDMEAGVFYAVDSWFLENGKPPFIIPLEDWKRGWRP